MVHQHDTAMAMHAFVSPIKSAVGLCRYFSARAWPLVLLRKRALGNRGRSQLDYLYQRVDNDLDELIEAICLKAA
jgi:hypothetical protein